MSQVPTSPVTIRAIMSSAKFRAGVTDVHAVRFDAAIDRWQTNDQWDYERGRQWGAGTPRRILLLRAGELTPEAVRWFERLDIL
jgi:hypothetical protein